MKKESVCRLLRNIDILLFLHFYILPSFSSLLTTQPHALTSLSPSFLLSFPIFMPPLYTLTYSSPPSSLPIISTSYSLFSSSLLQGANSRSRNDNNNNTRSTFAGVLEMTVYATLSCNLKVRHFILTLFFFALLSLYSPSFSLYSSSVSLHSSSLSPDCFTEI